jgi:hypothetical protein
MKQLKGILPLWVFVLVITIVFMMGGTGFSAESPCIADAKIDQSISSEAKLEEFSCSFKKFEGTEVVHFKVAIQNVSDKPQRFKVHIFLENSKAVGGLIPRKTKKGLVKPGETASFVYPVNGMTDKPKEVMLNIKTVMP